MKRHVLIFLVVVDVFIASIALVQGNLTAMFALLSAAVAFAYLARRGQQ